MIHSNIIHYIVLSVVCWTVFLIFIDYSKIKRNIWLGVIAYIMGVVVDYCSYMSGLYTVYFLNYGGLFPLLISKLITALPAGTLYAQYMPKSNTKQLLSIFILDIGYLLVELYALEVAVLIHFHWHLINSFIYNIFIFSTLAYVNKTFINKDNYPS